MRESESSKFANMGIVCAAMVVCMHVGGEFVLGSAGWWISECTRGGLSRVAVPYFFFASGFFLSGKFLGVEGRAVFHVWIQEVRKRVWTLLVPLLIWPVIWMIMAAPFTMVANRLAGRPLGHAVPFLNGELWPGVGALWFVRFLFILVVLSPIILLLVRRLGRVWLVAAFIVYWSVYTFLDPVNTTGQMAWCVYSFSLEGVAYFSAGMYIRLSGHNYWNTPRSTSFLLFVVGVALVVVSVACNRMQLSVGDGIYLNLRHFPLPFLMVGIFGFMPTKRFPAIFVSAAFPVYLMHTMWAVPITCMLNRISLIGATSAYLLRWILAFVTSILTACILRRYVPRVARVLFGGR